MDIVNKLINLFSDFPTVGPRTAGRFVFYLMKLPKEKIEEITNAILELKQKIKFCMFCLNPHQNDNNLCSICQGYNRDKGLLCILEKEQDLITIENTGKYKGLYFVLNLAGSLSRNADVNNLKLEGLKKRIQNPQIFGIEKANFTEIIIAINPTPEGINTSALVEGVLKEIPNKNFKITHLARGIPIGGELEYADQETLENALEGRK